MCSYILLHHLVLSDQCTVVFRRNQANKSKLSTSLEIGVLVFNSSKTVYFVVTTMKKKLEKRSTSIVQLHIGLHNAVWLVTFIVTQSAILIFLFTCIEAQA